MQTEIDSSTTTNSNHLSHEVRLALNLDITRTKHLFSVRDILSPELRSEQITLLHYIL